MIMDEHYAKKARTFVRVCMHCATSGVLNLTAVECLHLYKEVSIMALFLEDKDTMMLAYNQLGLILEMLQHYNEAVEMQQRHMALAFELENKAAQVEACSNLGNVYLLANKHLEAVSCFVKLKSVAIEIGDREAEGRCYGNMGALYHKLGRHDKAIKSFQQCLVVVLETNNTMYQKHTYINMAVAYEAMDDFPQVINCYEEWLKITTKDDDQELKGKVYESLGNAYLTSRDSHQAIKCYEKFLEIAKQLQDQTMEKYAYCSLGHTYHILANFTKAIDYYDKELELAIKMEDKNSEARVYGDLGEMYAILGNNAKAFELHEKALAIAVTIGNKSVEASANGNLGVVYQSQGDNHKAIKYHERQLQILKDIGSEDGKGRAYSSLGGAYRSLGNYYEAIKYHTKTLQISVETGDKNTEAIAHTNLGISYELLGKYHEAIAHNKNSLEIARQIEDKYVEGRAIGNLGTSLMKMDKFEEANECFEESLKIALELNDRRSEATAYVNLAKSKIILGQNDEALKMLDKQIRLGEEIADKGQQAAGYGSKGKVYLKLNDHQQAISCFEKELNIAKETDNKMAETDSYRNLGMLYGKLYAVSLLNKENGEQENRQQCITKSIHYLRESLRCREWVFDHLQEEDHLKISILETYFKEYDYLTTVLILINEHKEALVVSERGRARALDDVLVSKYNLKKQSGSDPISYAAIENMASDCSILFYSLRSTSHWIWIVGSDDSSALLFDIDKSGLSDIVNSAYTTLKVREVQCEDRSIQTDERQAKQKLSAPHKSDALDDTEKLLLSSYEMTKKRCIEVDLYDDDNPHPLEGLYKALISPVLHLLTKDELVIIPDGALFTVPFAALRDPNTGEFLSETKRIRLAPSLTSLNVLYESPVDFHSKTGALIIGNPQVGEVMFGGKKRKVADLPCAKQEAQMIGALLGVKPFIGSQATKEAIKENLLEGVAIIHFAAHGTTDGEIFLTPSSTGGLPSEEDYILTMKDVQESGVRPQLVVLSCCHSGRGEIKAEGVVGMSRAFLASGARAVVASLWAIADEATMVFMEKFYTHLKQGESASRSLQQAMKDMRELPRYSDPQFWAPFFLIGDDVTIKM